MISKKSLFRCTAFTSVLCIVAVFFLKATLVHYWYHLDPWVIQPLGELLESNLDWETNVMFPGLGLRLFYIFTVCFKLLTGVSYFFITKYGFIGVGLLFLFSLYVLIVSRYKQIKNVMFLSLLFLFLLLQNDFFLRRLSMTVRENYTLIALVGYLLVYYKVGFNKPFLSGIFSGVIYGSNPITSFILLGVNGLYGLHTLIKKDMSRFVAWIKQFLRGICIGIYFFIEFIKSLFWQYQHVEEEVVLKNPHPFDFYYITSKHINSLLLIILLFACIYFFLYGKKQKRVMVRRVEVFLFLVLLAVYGASFLPQVGLYQDRLIIYISIASFLCIIPFLSQIKNKILLLALGAFMIIKIGFISNYQYYSPFDLTELDLPAYKVFTAYTGDVLVFKFDEYVLRQTNSFMKVNYSLVDEFVAIEKEEQLVDFLAKHSFILFLTKATMRQEEQFYALPAIKMLTDAGSITTLEDGNFMYVHTN